MPGAVPFTSSLATLPYGLVLAANGVGVIAGNPGLCTGLNIHRGFVTHPTVGASLGMTATAPEAALAA